MTSISVIMANYNGAEHLEECVKSVLNQTFDDFEFLILDAGSTDCSVQIIESFDDHRIKLFKGKNIGLGANLNKLISEAQSSLVARMDSDDVMMPNRLMEQFKLMTENPNCVLSGTQIFYYNNKYTLKRTPFPTSDNIIQADLRNITFSLCHPTIIFSRAIAVKIGMYHINGFGEDLDFMLRMGQQGALMNTTTVGLKYRYSPGSASASKRELINCTYAFTIETFNSGIDTSFSDFQLSWRQRNFIDRISEYITNLGDKFYGYYIINYGYKPITSKLCLILSALLKPFAVLRHVKRRFSKFHSH